jgi:hypothetical protein
VRSVRELESGDTGLEDDHPPVLGFPGVAFLHPERIAVEGERGVEIVDGQNESKLANGSHARNSRSPGRIPASVNG